ncbi:MAG: hypothetical protein Q9201_004413 [Fulgogasparrea decipioides]
MSASSITTTVTHIDPLRHYGKFASFDCSQDMEIDRDLPRPVPSNTHLQAIDTSLDLMPNPSNDRSQTAATEPNNALPAKPPVARDAISAAEHTGVLATVAEVPGQTAHKPAMIPHLQQDLLTLFGLQPLAATVARTDPNTGEKINKIRKSYEGKVKGFGLAGRNRAVKQNHEKSMGLLQMTQWPAEEWYNQKVHGRDVRSGLPEATMQKLGAAMQMQPGPVQNTAEYDWEDLLGNEKVKPLPTIDERSKQPVRPDVGLEVNGQANGIRIQLKKAPITEANRPKRANKKRRYDDAAFEGYGEGFVDDEGDVLGDVGSYASDDSSRKGGAAKKRKKDYAPANPPPLGDRRGSYGIGMLGVGSGIGAYGR